MAKKPTPKYWLYPNILINNITNHYNIIIIIIID